MADGHIPAVPLASAAVAGIDRSAQGRSGAGHSHGPRLLDRLGIGVSLGCAIHCVAAGLVSALPGAALGLGAEWLELLEWPFLIGAAGIGLSALVPAFRDHGSRVPLSLFGAGIGLLVLSRWVAGSTEIMVTVPGVVAIASAHLVNLRLCHPPA